MAIKRNKLGKEMEEKLEKLEIKMENMEKNGRKGKIKK